MDPTASPSPDASPDRRRGRGSLATCVVLLLLWPFGPWLGFMGFIEASSIAGARTTESEETVGALLMLAGAVVAWGFPAIVLAVSGGRSWLRRLAVLELVAATVGVVGAFWLGTL